MSQLLAWSHLHHRPGPGRQRRRQQAVARPRPPEAPLLRVASADYPVAPARRSRAIPAASQPERRRRAVNRITHCSRDCSSSARVCRVERVTLRSHWPQPSRRHNNPPRRLRQHQPAQLAAHRGQARHPSVPRRRRAAVVPSVARQPGHRPHRQLRWDLPRRHLRRPRSHNRGRLAPSDQRGQVSPQPARTISRLLPQLRRSPSARRAQNAMLWQQQPKPVYCNASRQETPTPISRSRGAFPRRCMRRRLSRRRAISSYGQSASHLRVRYWWPTHTASATSRTG